MNKSITSISAKVLLFVSASLITIAFLGMVPAFADAASYAYVDAQGEVKMIVANDWRTAINTAPNIHIHSGVLLLDGASDFTIIGDDVNGY